MANTSEGQDRRTRWGRLPGLRRGRRVIAVGTLVGAVMAGPGTLALTPASAAPAAEPANQSVIVILKDQHHDLPARSKDAARLQALVKDQSPLISELSSTGAIGIKTFRTMNAVSATVTATEAERLATEPNVLEVVPDATIRRPSGPTAAKNDASGPSGAATSKRAASPAAASRPASAASAGSGGPVSGPVCSTGAPLLEPEALQVTSTAFDDPQTPSARKLGFTGKGVKVAFMAEGLDINNPDFIRADGSKVFVDYQDFSGDGLNAPTAAGEAFLDASAIAAQGLHTYDIQHFSAIALPTPCPIRIEGVAPGASLVGLKVFGQNVATTTSGFLLAIDYAVNVDHVDILNQSFGANPIPDTSKDAVRVFDQMAVEAGVTLTVSSGDAGVTNTIGSPASDPSVISVAGTDTYRWNAQTGYGAFPFSNGSWINDNITPLSSGGVDSAGRTVDMAAPGDSSFALCTPDVAKYADCVDFNNKPSAVERSGGTSESAPLTAGAAALVIEAYRGAHGGASPTPATVRQILTSSADDLGHPAIEQGAGRLNSLRAVQEALSLRGAQTPADNPGDMFIGPNQLNATAAPGTAHTFTLHVTNTGSATENVDLSSRALTKQLGAQQTAQVVLGPSNPTFTDWSGQPSIFQKLQFDVPKGADRLEAAIAYQGNQAGGLKARVRFTLLDPAGNFQIHSLAQGVGNYGFADVRNPPPGKWTAIIWTRVDGGTVGPVLFGATARAYETFGAVTPAHLKILPGETRSLQYTATTPSRAGDIGASLVFDNGARRSSVPVVLRSLVADDAEAGAFRGVLTGGNGRSIFTGQSNTFQFDVAAGRRDLDVNLSLDRNPATQVYAFLIDPHGQTLGYSTNQAPTATGTQFVKQVQIYRRNPERGRWTLVINFPGPSSGTELRQGFAGHVQFDRVDASASGLPAGASTSLPAGTPVTAQVTVRNTGIAPEAFFVDPRLAGLTTLTLAPFSKVTGIQLPLQNTDTQPLWVVPSETRRVSVVATATVPILFDWGTILGMDMASSTTGQLATGQFSAPEVTPGLWQAVPDELGVFPNGPPPAQANMSMTVKTQPFDPAVVSATGDLWLQAIDPNSSSTPVILQPGQRTTIPVTIVPRGRKGSVVNGVLYVDDATVTNVFGSGAPHADELLAIPYTYRVG